MKISNLNNSPAFGAYHIADTKNFINCIKTDIKIYKITQCDLHFLNSLKKNINLKTMMPKVDKNELEVWRELLNIGLQQAGEKCKNGLLAVFENKPCGIMAYTQKPKSFHDCRCLRAYSRPYVLWRHFGACVFTGGPFDYLHCRRAHRQLRVDFHAFVRRARPTAGQGD